ncbi:MAG TPA: hypothetical protein PLP06_10370 [Saprospiraceae bacterium]|nr:hypothetical protein [Saprospiraceae bacterium]
MYRIVIVVIFGMWSCRSDENKLIDRNYEVINPLTGAFINVRSMEGKKYTMPFTNLTYVTKNDILDYTVGNTERIQVLLGEKLLEDEDFKKLTKMPRVLIFNVDRLSPDSVLKKKLLHALKKDGYFNIIHKNDSLDTEMIYYAVELGYTIYSFEGSFYWKYEIPLKEAGEGNQMQVIKASGRWTESLYS